MSDARLETALEHHRAGRFREAQAIYRQLLEEDPANASALHLLGVLAHQAGSHDTARELIASAIALDSSNPDFFNHLGEVYRALACREQALEAYGSALRLRPDHAETLYNRANVLRESGRLEEALAEYERALAMRPQWPEALNNRGVVLKELDRAGEALASYDAALAARPQFTEALINRGLALHALGRYDEALATYEQALAIDPGSLEACVNRGNLLRELERFHEALATYDRALSARPQLAEILVERGIALQALRRFDEALESYELARQTASPKVAMANWNQSLCRLLIGDYERGWQQYEWRWKVESFPAAPPLSQPLWLGAEPIAGKRILLHAEQGLGDTIQICRYVPLVAQKGASVTLRVQPALQRLLADLEGVQQVVATDGVLPVFDLHCPLLSLPLAMGTRLDTIPAAVPYIKVPEAAAARWQRRLGTSSARRVGIAWSGRPGHKQDTSRPTSRPIALAALQPLLDTPGVQWISLQKEVRAADAPFLERTNLLHFGAELEDFADTAALLSLVDLVITIDTGVAHLAGALAKPVWILLPYVADWRWLLDRTDSPWYPTARLFRQPRIGDWQSPLAEVRACLLDWLRP